MLFIWDQKILNEFFLSFLLMTEQMIDQNRNIKPFAPHPTTTEDLPLPWNHVDLKVIIHLPT